MKYLAVFLVFAFVQAAISLNAHSGKHDRTFENKHGLIRHRRQLLLQPIQAVRTRLGMIFGNPNGQQQFTYPFQGLLIPRFQAAQGNAQTAAQDAANSAAQAGEKAAADSAPKADAAGAKEGEKPAAEEAPKE